MGLWLIRIETGFGLFRNNSDWFRNRFLNESHWFGINSQSETFAKVLDYCPTISWSVSDNELHPGLILPVPDLTRSGHESTRTIPTQFPAMQYSPSLPDRDSARNLFVMGLTGAISTRGIQYWYGTGYERSIILSERPHNLKKMRLKLSTVRHFAVAV